MGVLGKRSLVCVSTIYAVCVADYSTRSCHNLDGLVGIYDNVEILTQKDFSIKTVSTAQVERIVI